MHNTILKAFTTFVFMIWIFSGMSIDSETLIPFISFMVCSLYLGLFAYANNWFEEYSE